MSTSNNINDMKSKDPIDVLIFEKGVRIKTLFSIKDLDLLIVVLNNGKIIKSNISAFKRLKDASEEELSQWTLRQNGVGIHWEKLNEDLSLKGFITDALLQSTLQNLQGAPPVETELV